MAGSFLVRFPSFESSSGKIIGDKVVLEKVMNMVNVQCVSAACKCSLPDVTKKYFQFIAV